jgi:hypothetical protein
MKKQFIQLTSGWIPVSVLLLFTVALVAGQARANLPNEIKAAPMPVVTTSINIVLSSGVSKKLEALPLVVDTLLALPSDIELGIDARIVSPHDNGEHSSQSHSQPKSE